MSKDIVPVQDSKTITTVIEQIPIEQSKEQFRQLQQFIRSQMVLGRDYGQVPGTKGKPSLLKSGAEKLLNFHGLSCIISKTDRSIIDFQAGFFFFDYAATVSNPCTGAIVAVTEGSANSKESKFAFNWLPEYKVPRGANPADLEWKEVKGPKGKFKLYKVPNSDPFSLVNNMQKLAAKRAMVAAVLIACRASDIFSQDLTDEDDQEPSDDTPANTTRDPGISEEEARNIMAIKKSAGVTDARFIEFLKEALPHVFDEHGRPHLGKLSAMEAVDLTAWLEAYKGGA